MLEKVVGLMSGPCPMCDGEHDGKWNYCDLCLESFED
jgi:hypothetical protein